MEDIKSIKNVRIELDVEREMDMKDKTNALYAIDSALDTAFQQACNAFDTLHTRWADTYGDYYTMKMAARSVPMQKVRVVQKRYT